MTSGKAPFVYEIYQNARINVGVNGPTVKTQIALSSLQFDMSQSSFGLRARAKNNKSVMSEKKGVLYFGTLRVPRRSLEVLLRNRLSAKSSSSITILQFTRPTRPTYKFSLVGPTRVKTQYEITKIRRLSSPLRATAATGNCREAPRPI